jgi:isopropylmalate/homocitrate/citramalate synthase
MTPDLEKRIGEIDRWAWLAKESGLRVIVFISAAFGCSIEGEVSADIVLQTASRLSRIASVDEIVISDSTGQADPLQVITLLTRLADAIAVDRRLGLHFHDSRGAALANIFAALLSPFNSVVVDCAFGGWGGDVPFIPEAAGNVSSEDTAEMLAGLGYDLGIHVEDVITVAREAQRVLDLPLRSRVAETGIVRWKRDRHGG